MIKEFSRERVFFYHYNKPESQHRGKPIISVHFDNTCHMVESLEVNVPTWAHTNMKRSPKFVMKGRAKKFSINNEEIRIE